MIFKNILNMVFLFTSIQGIFFSFAFLLKKAKNKSNYYIAFISIVFSLNILVVYLQDSGLPYLLLEDFVHSLCIFLGVVALRFTISRGSLHKRKGLFWPLATLWIFDILCICLIRLNYYEIFDFSTYRIYSFLTLVPDFIYHYISPTIIFIYLVYSAMVWFQYNKTFKKYYSSLFKNNQKWVLLGVVISISSIVILFGAYIFPKDIRTIIHYYNYPIINSIMINILGYHLCFNPDLFTPRFCKEYSNLKTKWKRNSQGIFNKEVIRIKDFMANSRIYLEPDLTIADLADELSLHPNVLSEIINSYFSQNFFQWINSYRIKEACNDLLNPEKKDNTIIEIALNSGFNTKATFNSAFKSIIGQTPSHYRKNNQFKESKVI